jgi:hypothetical protein
MLIAVLNVDVYSVGVVLVVYVFGEGNGLDLRKTETVFIHLLTEFGRNYSPLTLPVVLVVFFVDVGVGN